ncbi:MAG: toprim domain-containing protein [Granulosicoccus sp.]
MNIGLFDMWQKAIDVAADSGIALPPTYKSLGEWHRVPGAGKGPKNDAGAYKVETECVHIIDHASGWSDTVFADSDNSGIDRAEAKRRHLAAERERKQKLKLQRDKAMRGLQWELNKAGCSMSTAYTMRKRITLPYSLPYSYRHQCAYICLQNIDGDLQTVQRLYDNGIKKAWPGLPVTGAFHLLGTIFTGKSLLICEGFATGCTLHEQTGHPVACAMFASNLMPVAVALRKRHPHHDIIVCGDDDRHTAGNPGRTKATEAAAAIGARVTFPVFPDGVDGTDFNDLHVVLQAVGV